MKKITFLLYSRNDEKNEQKRVRLSIESLLAQHPQQHKILFYDLSPGTPFDLPQSNILTVKHIPTKDEDIAVPHYYRNLMTLEVDTPILCHTNADCIFSRGFAEVLVNNVKEKTAVFCRRHMANVEQTDKIMKGDLQNAYEIQKKVELLDNKSASGECQCMLTDEFINAYGGYYHFIKDGKVERGHNLYREDTHFLLWVRNTPGINKKWVSTCWVMHLRHPRRVSKQRMLPRK